MILLKNWSIFLKGWKRTEYEYNFTKSFKGELFISKRTLESMVTNLKNKIEEARQKEQEAMRAKEAAEKALKEAEEARRKADAARREGMMEVAGKIEDMIKNSILASQESICQDNTIFLTSAGVYLR